MQLEFTVFASDILSLETRVTEAILTRKGRRLRGLPHHSVSLKRPTVARSYPCMILERRCKLEYNYHHLAEHKHFLASIDSASQLCENAWVGAGRPSSLAVAIQSTFQARTQKAG